MLTCSSTAVTQPLFSQPPILQKKRLDYYTAFTELFFRPQYTLNQPKQNILFLSTSEFHCYDTTYACYYLSKVLYF